MGISDFFFKEVTRRVGSTSPTVVAEALEEDPGSVHKWLAGQDIRCSTLDRLLEKEKWVFDRARPEYDPLRDALRQIAPLRLPAKGKSAGSRPALFTGDACTASGQFDVRVHPPTADEKAQKEATEEVTADDLWRAVNELRARMEETRRLTLSPEGEAPRAALIITKTGEVILDKAAPVDRGQRAITSAAGLVQLMELSRPKEWAASTGPLIIARQDKIETDGAERLILLRQPKDARPKPGLTCVVSHPDEAEKLFLRRLVALPGVENRMLAEGTQPGHENLIIDFRMTPVAAVLLAIIP